MLNKYIPICDAITALLSPNAEVVLHDVHNDRIVHISNPFSRREAGDPSLLMQDTDWKTGRAVLGPYRKSTIEGRTLKSVTSVLTDDDGTTIGLMCINLDVSDLTQARAALDALLGSTQDRPDSLFARDWRESLNDHVADFLRRTGQSLNRLNRQGRRDLIRELDGQGFFDTRNAANLLAASLNVARATIYNDLNTIRDK